MAIEAVPVSATWSKDQLDDSKSLKMIRASRYRSGSVPLRVGLRGELVGVAAGPVALGHARPHPVARRLQRGQDRALVGGEHAAAVHHQAPVDVDAVHVLVASRCRRCS